MLHVLSFLIVKNLLMGIIMKYEQLSELIKIIHFKSFLKLKIKKRRGWCGGEKLRKAHLSM